MEVRDPGGIGDDRWRLIFDHANDPMLLYHLDADNTPGRYIAANQAALRLYGYTHEEMLQIGPYDLLAPEVEYQEAARQLLTEGRMLCEIQHLTRDGRRLTIEVSAHRFQLDGQAAILTIGRDLTERRRGEEALRQRDRNLAATLERMSDAFLAIDTQWRLTYANAAISRLVGIEPDALVGQDFWQAFPKLVGTHFEETYRYVMDQREPAHFQTFSPVSGRWVDVRLYPAEEGLTLFAHDIHEEQLAQQALRESEERLRRLNQTLEERVAERTAVAEQRAAQLRDLAAQLTQTEQNERRRLAATLHDGLQQLLVAAKLRAAALGARTPRQGETDDLRQIENLIEQAIEMSRSLTVQLSPPILYEAGLSPALEWLARWMQDKHQLDVQVTFDPAAEPEAEEVRILLFEAARELLFNIVKHAEVSQARIEVVVQDDGVRMDVIDEGVGFDPKATAENPKERSGFGLVSLRQRVIFLGGRMDVVSTVGRGTQIILIAPRRRGASPLKQESNVILSAHQQHQFTMPRGEATYSGAGRIRVLLADDHKILREGLVSLLEEEPDIEVVGEASDGAMAVEMALRLQPDVIVMDITMPRMSGIEATRRITAEMSDAVIIGLSMHSAEDMAQAIRDAGAAAFLTKGGPAEDLVDTIRQVSA